MAAKPTYAELEKKVEELFENQEKYELITETIVHGVQDIKKNLRRGMSLAR